MNILIDGYNLIKQVLNSSRISSKQRRWFAQRLAQYARTKKHTIYIVYDAGPAYHRTREKEGPVVTIYSGQRDAADTVIMKLIDEGLVNTGIVVTTDRELNRYADAQGVVSIDAVDFYELMEQAVQPTVVRRTTEVQKMRPEESSQDLDALMERAAQMVPDYIRTTETHAGSEAKSAKKDKKIHSLLKKL